jgi:aldehyde:ferredoxin oxidoreductase
MNAVMGKVLWVNLTDAKIWEETIPAEVYERVLSGLGLAAYLLYQRMPPGCDPLGPENILGFVSGLLTGTGSLMTGRWMVVGKSPLTGRWGDSNCGGTLSPAIKQCGYDGIFFTGISPKPVYLLLEHGRAELRDASDLWGKDTRQTEDELLARMNGRQGAIACIGPAGEQCSLIAGISNDQGRMAARAGLGAVMGSKRLKAIALHGAYRIPVHNPQEIKRLSDRFNRFLAFQPPFVNGRSMALLGWLMQILPLQMRQDGLLYKILLRKWGTISMNQYSIETGDAPIRNWGSSNRDYGLRTSKQIDPDHIRRREQVKYHCYSCPVGCGGLCSLKDGNETHKPEYETVLALSGLLGSNDLEMIFEANELLNRAGMDSISAGGAVAFAIECYERGLLTAEETDGLELRWGNAAAVLPLLQRMVTRQGLGALLADGVKVASQRLGRGSSEFAIHAGGQELAMHDGRNDPGFALHAVVEPTPGRHTIGSYLYYETFQLWRKLPHLPAVRPMFYHKNRKYTADDEKAIWAAACSQFTQLMNGVGLCLFAGLFGVNRLPVFEWINAATGWQKSPTEYLRIGQNIQTIRQAFNVREKAALQAEIAPRAIGVPPLQQGANRNRSVPLNELVQHYWQQMGWDENGRPRPDQLQALGLEAPQ